MKQVILKISILLFGMQLLMMAGKVIAKNNVEFVVTKIADNVSVVSYISTNGHINLGVVEAEDGLLLINSWMAMGQEQFSAAIKSISDKPVKLVINSNADPYNHQGNEYWAEKGATIIAHENIRYSDSYSQMLFKDRLILNFGDERIIAYRVPSHSLAHINVYVEKSNVAFMADSFRNDWFSPQGEGGLSGYQLGIESALELGDQQTMFVPGNTGKKITSDSAEVIKVREVISQFTKRVGALYRLGKSADEIIHDQRINDIAQYFEQYENYKSAIKSQVISIIETNFFEPFLVSSLELKQYTGSYKLNEHSAIEIVFENGNLYAREQGKFLFELTPHSNTKFDFKAESRTDHIQFELSADGEVLSLTPVLEQNSWWLKYIEPARRLKSVN